MLQHNLTMNAREERQQLLYLALGLGVISVLLGRFSDARILPIFLLIIGLVALAGCLAYQRIGRDIYLVFALVSLIVGHVVSWFVVLILYLVGIAGVGTALCFGGMDRLRKNFTSCKRLPTMFVDAPSTDPDSFRRQS